MPECNRCGSAYELRTESRTVRFGKQREATVDAELFHCPSCGDSFFTLEQADAARLAASKEIRRREGLLMPEEIAAIRKRFGLSQDRFQTLLGKGKKTVVAWESGADFQSRLADKLLRVLRRFPAAVEFLAELEDIDLPRESGPAPSRGGDRSHAASDR